MVILVTGKAGAGKTTYANRLAEELKADGLLTEVLDSEDVRKVLKNNDYSDDGKEKHLKALAIMAAEAEEIGVISIVAAVAPKRAWRNMMRAHWRVSQMVYIPGGTMWSGTTYERPEFDEI